MFPRTLGRILLATALATSACAGSMTHPSAVETLASVRPVAHPAAAEASRSPTPSPLGMSAAPSAKQEGSDDPDDDDDADADADYDAEGTIDDAFDVGPPPNATAPPHPLSLVSDTEIERRLVSRPQMLGSMSIGKPNAGLLFNGIQMPEGDAWTV